MLQQRPVTPLERAVRWVLDPDGVMYGDEQERLRYYESSTFTASLHAVLVPWTLAACAWIGGRPVAPYVLALAVVFVVPWFLAGSYVRRRKVRPLPAQVGGAWVAWMAVTMLPYPLLGVGLALAFAENAENGFFRGLAGGMTGMSIAWVLVLVIGLVKARRQTGRE
jgi:hypothetical protein